MTYLVEQSIAQFVRDFAWSVDRSTVRLINAQRSQWIAWATTEQGKSYVVVGALYRFEVYSADEIAAIAAWHAAHPPSTIVQQHDVQNGTEHEQ